VIARMQRRRTTLRALAAAVLLTAARPALAHAEIETVDPPRDALLDVAPLRIRLVFGEPVETRFSLFKVYPLASASLGAADLVDPDFLRLNGLAAALVPGALSARDDADVRVDRGLIDTADRSADVTVALAPDLPVGAYVVMWRVLAIDGHTTQGHAVFVVRAPAQGEAE